MKLCLCKLYYTLLSLMGCKFCSIMSPWKMTPLIKKNSISNHWKLKISTCDFKIISMKIWTMKNITMKIWKFTLVDFTSWNESPWKLYLCKWFYCLFWLVGYTFCNNMSPWNNTLATMKNGTYNRKKWHLWSKKLIPITIKNSKLAHVILKKYHENYNHENDYHEILKNYTNEFDTMKWTKKFHMYPLVQLAYC